MGETKSVARLRLGVFGNEGSYTEEAGLRWAREGASTKTSDVELCHLVKFSGLLLALEQGRIDKAVLPLHNSHAGLVLDAIEALSSRSFRIVDQVVLAVHHCLCLHTASVAPDGILAVVSHPQALAQCEGTIAKHFPMAQRVSWNDTASAARDLALGVLPAETTAILASRRAAELFSLFVLVEDAQDDDENRTTFAILERAS